MLILTLALVAIIAIGFLIVNSTLTGNIAWSKSTTIFAGDTGRINFEGNSYIISNVEVTKTNWASFTITNEGTDQSADIEGVKTSEHIINLGDGSIRVRLDNVVYPATNIRKRFISIRLLKN